MTRNLGRRCVTDADEHHYSSSVMDILNTGQPVQRVMKWTRPTGHRDEQDLHRTLMQCYPDAVPDATKHLQESNPTHTLTNANDHLKH